ncbi:MAG TPA: sulfur oxidation c-type cytochrome SoxX [Gammaproteobacteria bacterium]|jgi:sulfur-oxidizing protein SoxX|nr:sulfur oxidation c-type cytochrome SoxX [Gammaproteobacteria bacterium]|tara:strand:+ start:304 stop:753 length:450 start_codon:yes stop_codon:yes gene_type:complete
MRWTLSAVLLFLSIPMVATTEQQALRNVGDAIAVPLSDVTGSAEKGEKIFAARDAGHCVLCHQVNGLDAPFQGNIGPALSGIGDRLSPAQIRLRIVDASILNPQTIMPSYYRSEGLHRVDERYEGRTALSGAQIEHLVAYLAQLRSQNE